MSTLESFTRTTTALGLGLFLAACSGPAPIDGASHAAQAPGTKGDLTQLSASASTSDQPSDGVATDKPLQAPATDQELAMDDAPAESPATNLRDEEKVGWNDKKREPKSSEHSDVPWPDTTGYEVVSDKQLRIYFEGGPKECVGYRTEVVETDKEVRVTLIQGTQPDVAKDAPCPAVLAQRSLLVDLKKPLDNRRVVSTVPYEQDGADN